jgi:CheY-like chemotaxis protein
MSIKQEHIRDDNAIKPSTFSQDVELSLSKKEVLIVDDDPVFRTLVSNCLEKFSCRVRVAENGLEGLKSLREGIPDILLCDLSMPVMSGGEFVEEVSQQYPMLPMIVVSGTGDMKDVAKMLRYGVKDFLVKPLDSLTTLISSLTSALKDADSTDYMVRDFSGQWFKTDDSEEQPEDQELQWHLQQLKENPNAARELLVGLLPERDSNCGSWWLNYRVLQSTDELPIVFDYSWLIDGRLVFYILDSSTGGENSVGTSLLVRAFFDDYIRNTEANENNLEHLVARIERGMSHSGYADAIEGLFGIINVADQEIDILPVGLSAIWQPGATTNNLSSMSIPVLNKLGKNSQKNQLYTFNLTQYNGTLHLHKIGSSSFSCTIKRVLK